MLSHQRVKLCGVIFQCHAAVNLFTQLQLRSRASVLMQQLIDSRSDILMQPHAVLPTDVQIIYQNHVANDRVALILQLLCTSTEPTSQFFVQRAHILGVEHRVRRNV